MRAIRNFQWRRDAWILVGNLRSAIERQIGIPHLRERIEFRVRVVFPGDRRQVRLFGAILIHVNLRDLSEKLWEHEIAVLRFLVVIIGGRAENIRAIERRHCFLLLRANDEHRIVKPAHDPFRAEQNGKRSRSAGRFGVHRRNAAQFRVDLRNKSAELQLFGELAGVEISDRTRLNLSRVDFGVIERILAGFDDQMPDRFPFLLQVALKIGAPAAEDINWLAHTINLANLAALSSRTDVRDLTKSCNAFKNRIAFNNALASSIIFGSGKHTASRRDPSLGSG